MAFTAYTSIGPTAGVSNIKGVYTQIVASTPYNSSRLYMITEFANGGNRMLLIDIATGAAAAETVIISNVAVYCDSDIISGTFGIFSVDIPSGSRLSVRCQSNTGASIPTLHFYLENRALGSLTNPVTYGADTANSRGTQIDPGAVAATKGSYVQLTASTSARIDGLMIYLTAGTASVALTGQRWSIDIATGAGGAETIIIPDITVAGNAPADGVRPGAVYFPVSIPAGTRIAVRCNCNVNTVTIRLICVELIGMQEPTSSGGATSMAYVS